MKKIPEKKYHHKILLVEDNILNQHAQTHLLQQLGCQVLVAGTGKEALENISSEFDLLLLDIELPDMSGFSVLRSIRERKGPESNIPVAVVTGCHAEKSSEDYIEEYGLVGYIVKPVIENELLLLLESVPASPKADAYFSATAADDLSDYSFD